MSDGVRSRGTFGTMYDTIGEILRADSPETVARLTRETAADLLERPDVYVHLLDTETTRLVPAATPTDAGGEPDRPTAGPRNGALVWEAYLAGTTRVRDASADPPVFGRDDDPPGAVVVPVGEHGVLTVVGDREFRLDEEESARIGLIVRVAEAALDRSAYERRLTAVERERRSLADRLDRLEETSRRLADIERVVVRSRTRDEMERTLCDRLLHLEDVVCAWVGERDASTETLVPRVWSVDDREFFDGTPLDTGTEAADVSPAVRAARTLETARVADVSEDLRSAAWRREALSRGVRSILSVPVTYEGKLYGVLTICSDRPGAFEGPTVDLLESLAESAGHAAYAHDLRQAFYTDSVTRLEVCIEGADDLLSRIARETGARVEFESVVPDDRETTRVVFATTGAPTDRVADVLDRSADVEAFDHLATRGDAEVFQADVRSPFVVAELAAQGGAVQRLVATGETTTVAVELPRPVDVRSFVDRLRGATREVTVRSREDHERPVRTRQSFRERLEEHLTDRQLEVLSLAARSGYFEWPREVTAQELAETLGVSQPTFSRHLREAERKFVELVFDDPER